MFKTTVTKIVWNYREIKFKKLLDTKSWNFQLFLNLKFRMTVVFETFKVRASAKTETDLGLQINIISGEVGI